MEIIKFIQNDVFDVDKTFKNKTFKDVTEKDINDYLIYEWEHNRDRISDYFKQHNIKEPLNIKNYTQAKAYVNAYTLNKEFVEDINTEKIFSNLDMDTLTEEDIKNLSDYILGGIKYDFKIETMDELRNFKEICRVKYIEKSFKEKSLMSLSRALMHHESYSYMLNIYNHCLEIEKVASMDEKVLENEFNITKKEIKCIKLISTIKTYMGSDDLTMDFIKQLYDEYKSYDFYNADFKDLRDKIRKIFATEISSSLTKMSDMKDLTYNEEDSKKYGVPVYTKDSGEYKFLVHTIYEGIAPNTRIANFYGARLYKNPELWYNLPKDIGTSALSTSLISNNGHAAGSGNDTIYYGFDELIVDDIRNMSFSDAATPHSGDGYDPHGSGREYMMFSDNLIDTCFKADDYPYNEVAFYRYNKDGSRKKPKFILCYNRISSDCVNHAKAHNVPILVINTKNYEKEFMNKIEYDENKIKSCDKNNIEEYINVLENILINVRKLARLKVTYLGYYPYSELEKLISAEISKVENKEFDTEVNNEELYDEIRKIV